MSALTWFNALSEIWNVVWHVSQASVLARVVPPVIFLQPQRSCPIPSFIPITFMSLSTHLFNVFLGAPLPTTPVTFILVHYFTQSFSSFRSTCPNHLNRALWILFSTHSMLKWLDSSSLLILSRHSTHPFFHHPLSHPQVLHFHSPWCLATIYTALWTHWMNEWKIFID